MLSLTSSFKLRTWDPFEIELFVETNEKIFWELHFPLIVRESTREYLSLQNLFLLVMFFLFIQKLKLKLQKIEQKMNNLLQTVFSS